MNNAHTLNARRHAGNQGNQLAAGIARRAWFSARHVAKLAGLSAPVSNKAVAVPLSSRRDPRMSSQTPPKPSISYKDAGVDIDAGNALIDRIKHVAKRTSRPEVMGGLGGFGALCEIPAGYR